MNIVSRKHAQDLIATFRQEGTLPYGCRAPLPPEQVSEQIETYTSMFEAYRGIDDTSLDEHRGKGTVLMTTPEMQWCLDYRGNPKDGELNETCERATFHDHCLVRYGSSRVDVLNLHVGEHGILAQALQLDRRRPENSSVLVYQWRS